MSSLTIRKLDEDIKHRLRVRAAREGVSMEEAARRIIAAGVRTPQPRSIESLLAPKGTVVPGNIADAIAAIVDPVGGIELDIPPRTADWNPPTFDDSDEDAAA